MTLDNRDYLVVNAFAKEPFGGNPAGVFPVAEGLSDADMQNIARQLNLVETAFVFPSHEAGVDRHLRYFTPLKELPVTGHPTIAAWTALLHEGLIDSETEQQFKQRTGAGIQNIKIMSHDGRKIVQMMQPEAKYLSIVEDRERAASVFGLSVEDFDPDLPIRAVDTGLGHIIACVRSLDCLMRAKRNIEELAQLCSDFEVREAQLFAFEARDASADLHTRNLCPRQGIEDPACGVGNGALGAFLAEHHNRSDSFNFSAEQGHIVQMPSVIDVAVSREDSGKLAIYIGGEGVVMSKGRIFF